MICPNCSTELPDNAKFCLECGKAFDKVTETPTSDPSQEEKTDSPTNSEKKTKDGLILGLEDIDQPKEPKKKRSPVWLYILYSFIALVLGVGLYFGYMYISGNNNPTTNKINNFSSKIEEITNENGAVHRITVYAADSQSIILSSHPFSKEVPAGANGITTIDLMDSELIQHIGSSTAKKNIYITVSVRTKDKKILPAGSVSTTITYPTAEMEILTKEFDSDKPVISYLNEVNISYKVDADCTVFVNDKQQTLNRFGYGEYKAQLNRGEENSFKFVVQKEGIADLERTIVINSPVMEVPLEITHIGAAELDIPEGTNPLVPTANIEFSGRMPVNTKLDIVPAPKSLLVNPETGEFKAKVPMTKYGSSTVVFKATKDGKTSRIDRVITYSPDINYYTRRAQAYTDKIISNPSAHNNIAFQLSNVKIKKLIQADTRCVYLGVLPDNNNVEIALEVSSEGRFTEEKSYKVFADVEDTYSYEGKKLPLFKARFIYPK